ncbi:MAG: LysR family transcriptional regulator [Sulfitobacter sp.]
MTARTLDHIPAFHAVMTHGSLSAAARDLRLAQPTVRRHIEALETLLNTALFTRAANGLTPTAMAHTLLPMARNVLEQAEALARSASAHAHALEGTVRLTCSRIVATHVLPGLLAEIRAQAPGIRFEVAATDTAENLARRAADIAIRFTPPAQQALVAVKLPDVELGVFTAKNGPCVSTIDDLVSAPFLSDDREDQVLPAIRDAGWPQPANVVLRSDDPLAVIAHLQAGLGVSICQVKLAGRLGLVRVLPQVTYPMPAWLVVHEDQSRIARIRFVFDHLKTGLSAWM